MKKQISHIIFLLFTATLVSAAGMLAFNGLNEDNNPSANVSKSNLSLDDQPVESALDTARFFEKSCYEYCQLENTENEDVQVDVLSKTVVKVENDKGDYEDIEKSSIKKFPANQSLNLMVEKYTLTRKMVNCSPSFFVTVESFNTLIHQSDFNRFTFDTKTDFQTSLGTNDFDLMRAYCDKNGSSPVVKTVSRPL